MGRSPCRENVGLKRGPWTPEEDQKLLAYIEEHGHGSWPALPAKAGLQRCGKSCRLRWTNYLRPDIKRGKFSLQEEQSIIQLHALLGNRWSAIATHLPKRTDNEIKNYWNTHLKRRLTKMGIDPVTHKPKSDSLSPGQLKVAATLSHIAQWESARLEAEARATRIVRESTILGSFPSSSASAQLILNKANAPPPLSLPPPPLPLQPLCLDVLTAWKGAWLTTLVKENGSTITGTLETPTSTLNFSDNQLLIPNLGKSNNNIGEVKESMDNNTVLVPNFMEGLTDLLIENSHDHDLNDFEENNNYWNSIWNLVNSTSPSIGSPVF